MKLIVNYVNSCEHYCGVVASKQPGLIQKAKLLKSDYFVRLCQ